MSSKCPKCGEKLSVFYLKQTCPKCGVNLMYYKLDERLEEDAANAAAEVERVDRFVDMLKRSTIKSPLSIIRLILFFTPLASMCLPMYRAGSKNVSLIGFILSLVNHGFGIAVWSKDYLFSVLAMVCVILFSLAVIISSLFSAGKRGYRRNIIFSLINTAVFTAMSYLTAFNGGKLLIGFYVTGAIYFAEIILHYLVASPKTKKRKTALIVSALLCAAAVIGGLFMPSVKQNISSSIPKREQNTVRVVSYNTAAPWGTPFDDTKSEVRVVRFKDYIERVDPDLFGTQELNSSWLEYLKKNMAEYESYAVLRGGDDSENTSEMNGIFWLRDKYTAVETNTFWLSHTPEKESRFTYNDENGEEQEAGCNRICSYAILKDKNGKLIAFMNTHLDNSSEEAMNYGAALIVKRIGEIKDKYSGISVILTGDFNQNDEGIAYRTISSALNDTTDENKQKGTWQDWGYTETNDKPIDFIFTSGSGKTYCVLDDVSNGYISDHYGIMSDIEFN